MLPYHQSVHSTNALTEELRFYINWMLPCHQTVHSTNVLTEELRFYIN